ncbi:lysophospholipid acyltransferase family protein [Comamonadaceae bacterium M7527]|nr:lysophospholipid acyltransferase family protein [Comamonadaceae bacterium M7527]
MLTRVVLRFFKLASYMPLWLLHNFGAVLGVLLWLLDAGHRSRMHSNAKLAGLTVRQRIGAVVHAGCMVAELPRLWLGKPVPVVWCGLDTLRAAVQTGHSLALLTPHMGCFEINAKAYAQEFAHAGLADKAKPMTVLFRPSRQAGLQELVRSAREGDGLHAAPTNMAGVKQLMRALKNKQAVGLLPDQVPPNGMGIWSRFLGQPAYTMTLGAKLAQQADHVLLMWGERLSFGRGFKVHVIMPPSELPADIEAATQVINHWVEYVIAQAPQQYMWGYARFKKPKDTQPL